MSRTNGQDLPRDGARELELTAEQRALLQRLLALRGLSSEAMYEPPVCKVCRTVVPFSPAGRLTAHQCPGLFAVAAERSA